MLLIQLYYYIKRLWCEWVLQCYAIFDKAACRSRAA